MPLQLRKKMRMVGMILVWIEVCMLVMLSLIIRIQYKYTRDSECIDGIRVKSMILKYVMDMKSLK